MDAPATPAVGDVGQDVRWISERDEQDMVPRHISTVQWEQATGCARAACARIFRDGGTPGVALRAFGLVETEGADWSTAVDRIAQALCTPSLRKAA